MFFLKDKEFSFEALLNITQQRNLSWFMIWFLKAKTSLCWNYDNDYRFVLIFIWRFDIKWEHFRGQVKEIIPGKRIV